MNNITNIETVINETHLRELYIDLHLLKYENGRSNTNVIKSSNIEYLYLDLNDDTIKYTLYQKNTAINHGHVGYRDTISTEIFLSLSGASLISKYIDQIRIIGECKNLKLIKILDPYDIFIIIVIYENIKHTNTIIEVHTSKIKIKQNETLKSLNSIIFYDK